MVKSFSDKVTAAEINYILKHFDQGKKGYVSKSDFMNILSGEIREAATSGFQLSIEDIIKPLATRCLKFNVNMDRLFTKIDKNHNGRVSAEELAAGLLSEF
jgi:Ca2+-binding EF-hand superfamily protein